jgi:type II secretory pathway pseudopilin PulG
MVRIAKLKKRQLGVTLVELAIVIGAVGLVVGGIWAAATRAQDARRTYQAVEQVQLLVEAIRNRYLSAAQLPNQDFVQFTQTVAQADLFPRQTRLDATINPADCSVAAPCYFSHAWSTEGGTPTCGGGTLCVSANNVFGGLVANFGFVVQVRQLPANACIALGSRLVGLGTGIGLVAMGTDSSNPDSAVPANINAAPTVAWLTANCDNDNRNNLYLAFRLSAS